MVEKKRKKQYIMIIIIIISILVTNMSEIESIKATLINESDISNNIVNEEIYENTVENEDIEEKIIINDKTTNEMKEEFFSEDNNNATTIATAPWPLQPEIQPISTWGMNIIINYHHADGSLTTDKERIYDSETIKTYDSENKKKDNEEFAGLSITTGHGAVTIDGTKIKVQNQVRKFHLVVVNYYYKDLLDKVGSGINEPHDTAYINGEKIYDTSRMGLHTDKTAKIRDGELGLDGRTFDLTLESWYVKDNIADVGLVLDASGSMVWTSETPRKINVNSKITSYIPYKILTEEQVDTILDKRFTDNSRLSYNGYKYYVFENNVSDVKEYVPLGYSDGTTAQFTTANNISDLAIVMDNQKIARASNIPSAGWYYVNSGGEEYYNSTDLASAKVYSGIDKNVTAEYTIKNSGTAQKKTIRFSDSSTFPLGLQISVTNTYPTLFYIDNEGYLNCIFYRGSKNIGESSYVYEKQDESNTKAATLQDSISRFASNLNGLSPSSKISMTRFSRNAFGSDTSKLVLLDWSNNTKDIISAMSLDYGKGTSNYGSSFAYTTSPRGIKQYNYGHTGQTSTQTGVKAFIDHLDGTSGLNDQSKYLILFTDGKDTDIGDDITSSEVYKLTQKLKAKGYTIFTVMMQSAGTDNEGAKVLLELLSSKDENGNPYYFPFDTKNPEKLSEIFIHISKIISKALKSYTVIDYIDPRFDLIDDNGNILTNENNKNKEITLSDGKTFTLGYDTNKDMYYIEWKKQEIPSVTQFDNDLNLNNLKVWSSTITVRAKEDFIGGNNIPTNGNEKNMNYIFDPNNPGFSGVDNADGEYPSKGFPITTVSPKLLNLDISNGEETIFFGESIKPSEFLSYLESTVDNKYYIEYLDRISKIEAYKDAKSTIASGKSLTVPYYYLPNDDNSNQTGTSIHKSDQIGTIIYDWIECDKDGNILSKNGYDEFITSNTDDIFYKLKIKYTPISNLDRKDKINDLIGDLKNLFGDKLIIKDTVGDENYFIEKSGVYTVHIVDGEIIIQKKIKYEDLIKYLQIKEVWNEEFKFTIERAWSNKTETYKEVSIYVSFDKDDITSFKSDGEGYVTFKSEIIDNIPVGNYIIREIDNDNFVFDKVEAGIIRNSTNKEDILFSSIYQGKEENFISESTISESNDSLVIHIGQVIGSIPKESTVVLANEEKKYLNAQLGLAVIKNKSKLGSVKVIKEGKDEEPLAGVKFKLEEAVITTSDNGEETWNVKDEGISVTGTTVINNGKAQYIFENLPIGYYILTEIETIDGYSLLQKSIHVTIPTKYSAGIIINGSVAIEDGMAFDVTYTVKNNKIFQLPENGGGWSRLYYFVLAMCLIISALSIILVMYLNKKNLD